MPPAVLAWLDYSEADQRRAREIIAMFSQRESRDELGLGVIRDALSDTLFPGTSVLLTRARYFLFVPWLFREGARRGRRGTQLSSWVEQQERRLIGTLRSGGDLEGLIGRYAGSAVQNLPSDIYWNSLRRFGILRQEGTAAQTVGFRQTSGSLDDATEFLEHSDAVWAPSIPAAPGDFFSFTHCDFALTPDEASWLAERIAEAVPDTMLQFLVTKGTRPSVSARYVWEEPEADAATERVRDALEEARRFAVAMHGAACSTMCSLPNAPRSSASLVMRVTVTTSQPDLTTGTARSRQATLEVGIWTCCGRWSPIREDRLRRLRGPS